jgi:hypothetical protein
MSKYTIDFKYNSSFTLDIFWGGSFYNIYKYIFYMNKKGDLSLNLQVTIFHSDNTFGMPSSFTKKIIKDFNIENVSHPIIKSHKSNILKIFNQLKTNINYFRNIVLNELLEFALNPDRIQWLLDETQKKYWKT